MNFLVLVSAEGIETTGSVLCGTEQVAVSVNLEMAYLVWNRSWLQLNTYSRDTKEVNVFRRAES
jgi:hypothetical protein